jgi:hypothetical protein
MKLLEQIKQGELLRKYLPFLVVGFLLAAAYPAFLHPMLQAVQASVRGQSLSSLYQERLASLEQIGSRLNRQRQKLREWKETHSFQIFTPAQAKAFLASLENRADAAGCQLTAIEYEDDSDSESASSDKAGSVQTRQVKMQMLGSFDSWIQWLEQAESIPQCVLLDSLKLDWQDQPPETLTGRVCLRLPVAWSTQTGQESPNNNQPEGK